MYVRAAIDGSLSEILRQQTEGVKRIITDSVVEAATYLKETLRGDIRAAGLGDRLAKAMQQTRYPKSGISLETAAVVFSKAQKLHRVFMDGAVIRSSKGLFLAIPTEACPDRITGKRPTPALFERHIGKLRMVYRPNAPSLLVAENQRSKGGKRGGYARASERQLKTGRGLATVVMFILVRQVRLKKRFDLDGPAAAAERRLVSSLENRLARIPESPQ